MISLSPRQSGKRVGVIFTGMERDGANGLIHGKRLGATDIAKAPSTAAVSSGPRAAVETGTVDFILTPEQIRDKLILLYR